jgi:RsiW-degrading membrane proteinase PrsW (M82 family)
MANFALTLNPLTIAILGGVLPALLWLFFWLHEDNKNPEPKGLIFITFCAGMLAVYLVLPLQQFVVANFAGATLPQMTTALAAIEELMKFGAVFFIAFKTSYFDEPIDAVIYLVTAALGFAAMENILYAMKDMAHGGSLTVLLNGSSRFLGAEILHTISSMIIGITMAYSFYSGRFVRTVSVVLGLAAAILLHAYFNLTIMNVKGTMNVLMAFTPYWATIIIIIVVLEFVKRLKQPTK